MHWEMRSGRCWRWRPTRRSSGRGPWRGSVGAAEAGRWRWQNASNPAAAPTLPAARPQMKKLRVQTPTAAPSAVAHNDRCRRPRDRAQIFALASRPPSRLCPCSRMQIRPLLSPCALPRAAPIIPSNSSELTTRQTPPEPSTTSKYGNNPVPVTFACTPGSAHHPCLAPRPRSPIMSPHSSVHAACSSASPRTFSVSPTAPHTVNPAAPCSGHSCIDTPSCDICDRPITVSASRETFHAIPRRHDAPPSIARRI